MLTMSKELENANVNNTIYQLYKATGYFTVEMKLCAIILPFVGVSGILMNIAVLWVTIMNKKLRGTANYLLCLSAIYEILHQYGHLTFFYCVFIGQRFIVYSLGVQIASGTLFGLGGLAPTLALTGLDRLLIIVVPNLSQIIRPHIYCAIFSLITLGFAIWNVTNFYATASTMPDILVAGSIQELMKGQANDQYSLFGLIFNGGTLCIYILVGIVIKLKRVGNKSMEYRIYRSLATIICIYLSGYIVLRVFRLFIVPMIKSSVTVFFASQFCSLATNISAAMNGPVLYITSSEYRNAALNEFNRIKRILNSLMPAQRKTTITMLVNVKQPALKHGGSKVDVKKPISMIVM